MKLNQLSDNQGAHKTRKRVGRGPASGKGKTAGRGHKGQKSRSGVAIKGFEGGQMPLYRRLPKRGFNQYGRKEFIEISLQDLQIAIDKGVLKAGETYDAPKLLELKIVSRIKDGVKLLANGELKSAVNLNIAGATKSAIKAVESAGGSVTLPEVKQPEKQGKKHARKQFHAEKNAKRRAGE